MSRGIRKTGVLAMVVMLAATLSGCRLAKKEPLGRKIKKDLFILKRSRDISFFINTIRKKIRSAWMVIHS